MAKTKSVGGKDYSASDFAYVGNLDDPETWHLLIADASHVRDALARFNQTDLPAEAKGKVARKLMAEAKKFGIDASGFAAEHNLKASEAESFEDIQAALDQALLEQFGLDTNGYRKFCLLETFPEYLIARGPDGDLWQISYSYDANDELNFGEPQEVETAYVPVQEAVRFMAGDAGADDGLTWPIQVMQAGFARGTLSGLDARLAGLPHYFPAEVVAQVAEGCRSTRFGRCHPKTDADETDPDRVAGFIDGGHMAGTTARATLHLFPQEKEIQAKLTAARDAGKLDLFGASILAYFAWKPAKAEGRDALVAQKLGRLVSVDFVTEAGAGGKILPYAASRSMLAEIAAAQNKAKRNPSGEAGRDNGGASAVRTKGAIMKNAIVKVLEALRKHDAGRAAELQKEFDGLAEDKHAEFMAKASEALAAATNVEKGAPAAKQEPEKKDADVLAKAQEALAEAKRIQFGATLERKLTESKLPPSAVALVREHFAGTTAEETAVDVYIVKTREAFAAFTKVGRLNGGRVEVGRESLDKIQMAMDATLGVKEALKDPNVHAFRGIREAYEVCTADRDVRMDGTGFYRVSEAIATADFPNILLSSLTKKLTQDYAEVGMGGLERLYIPTRLGDYKTQDRVRLGYLGDMPTVAEAGPYTELVKPTDEKISYTPAKRGGLLTISEETIRNDDLGKIAAFPARMARAARRSLKQFITDFFVNNPLYDPDGVAIFAAGHSNLGAAALSIPELNAREAALLKQTEKDSGKRLGLPLQWIMVPVDLKSPSWAINNSDINNPGPGIEEANPWFKRFGQGTENIIVNELLADANDWYGGCFPSEAPFLEIGFLDGYETPQIFLANLPTQGTQFTNDQLQYKLKFVFGGKPIDFRPVFKNVVA